MSNEQALAANIRKIIGPHEDIKDNHIFAQSDAQRIVKAIDAQVAKHEKQVAPAS